MIKQASSEVVSHAKCRILSQGAENHQNMTASFVRTKVSSQFEYGSNMMLGCGDTECKPINQLEAAESWGEYEIIVYMY